MSSYWSSPLKINNNQIGPVDNRHRIYVTDLGPDCTEELIAKAFSKWPIIEIWHAKASCFAFIVLQNRVDVEQAIDELDGQSVIKKEINSDRFDRHFFLDELEMLVFGLV